MDEEIEGRRLKVVSWDVTSARRPLATWVYRLVYGREERVRVDGHTKAYRYAGYVDAPGVTRIGQSVLLMPPGLADELIVKLAAHRIPCTATEVYRRLGPVRR
ncbi:MAG TPA: hypothetical protein VJ397_10405 [Thermoplasmata archaeon]|nr:hypothetical protein [Thermoplasmata archaeon]